MRTRTRRPPQVSLHSLLLALLFTAFGPRIAESAQHPLQPPDRTSPRATLATFVEGIERAWRLYADGEQDHREPFRDARECLDLSEVTPLVRLETSAESALLLKEVLDRIELSPEAEIPDAAQVAELGITRWTIPHTEITLSLMEEGDHVGEWLFTTRTVARAEEFYERVEHLPYMPGREGGHIEELRSVSEALFLMKLVNAGPAWLRGEIGGMLAWQWFGLMALVTLLTLAVFGAASLSRRWRESGLTGCGLARYLVPLVMIAVPFGGGAMIRRLFTLPGEPAFFVRLVFSVAGYAGLIWLVALALTHVGELSVRFWFHAARPLKKQLVRVIFRIVTIVVVTTIALIAAQRLGVPVAGLIAGVGVGGLAIALAAQGTLENFIGGIILYADQPVRVGDVCRFGDRRGTVEDVGLRSVRIRTLDRTLVTVPNADFARLQLENLSERDRVLLREEIHLRYETTRDQLLAVLSGLRTLLEEHEQIAEEPMRVRFTGIGDSSLEVELFAYALTSDWPDFLEIREQVLVKVMEVVEQSGTRLALPTEVHYQAAREADARGAQATA